MLVPVIVSALEIQSVMIGVDTSLDVLMDSVALTTSRAHSVVQIASAKTQRDCTKMQHKHQLSTQRITALCAS